MQKLAKLHRSTKHAMIAGVCGGIAEYLGWSPTMVRLAFILLIILTAPVTFGGGVLIYLIMWTLMPKATVDSYVTTTQYREL